MKILKNNDVFFIKTSPDPAFTFGDIVYKWSLILLLNVITYHGKIIDLVSSQDPALLDTNRPPPLKKEEETKV